MTRTNRLLRNFGLGIALLAAAGCSGGSSNPTSPSVHPANLNLGLSGPKKVTAFGDSITLGILELRRRDLGLATANNYPTLLQRRLRTLDSTWIVTNRGVGGEETGEGAARLPGVLAVDRPGVVLLMEGTNDARKCWSGDEAVRNLRTMVRTARQAHVTPLLATLPPSFSHRSCTHEVIADINDQIRANPEGAVLVDMFSAMNNAALFGEDHLHPNERGYAVMAETWFQAIQQASGGGTTVAQRRQP